MVVKNRKIVIISYYNSSNDENKRTGSPAAKNVINYLSEVICSMGYTVDIFSPSWIIDPTKRGIYLEEREPLKEGCALIKAPSFAFQGRAFNLLNKIISRVWIIEKMVFNIKKEDIVFLYHEPTLMLPIGLFKRLKKHSVNMIAEEIYSDIPKFNYIDRNREIQYLREIPSSYIVPTVLLNNIINNGKPYTVVHGTYHVEKTLSVNSADDKIHVVYAGTFNSTKGGAAAAVAAAEFLSDNYHVHIIGFGTNEEKKQLVNLIEEVNKKARCKVSFDGLKLGEEYTRFIQSCDIGLSVQNPDAVYNDTSFPSKVLSYLSNGLRVVSIRIKALETSSVNDLLYYYNEQTPAQIAEAIMHVDLNSQYDSRQTIMRLNQKARNDIEKMIEEVYCGK